MKLAEILGAYKEITQLKENELGVTFEINDIQFLLVEPDISDPTSNVTIYTYNSELSDYPHILLKEIAIEEQNLIPEGIYRRVCLYEYESIISSILSYEEKINDAVNRLIQLLSLTQIERENEFQKEFLYYWNNSANNKTNHIVYLSNESLFTKMDVFCNNNKDIRLVENMLLLSDINTRDKNKKIWVKHLETEVFYIPLIDCRDIIPPHHGYQWTTETLKSILAGVPIEHISKETYLRIKNDKTSTQNIILVFGMETKHSFITYALKLICKNNIKQTIIEKIESGCIIETLYTTRNDYLYLCEQIGNSRSLTQKRVLLIGAGSLGSYIASELIKNGINNLTIYDNDNLEKENILRWFYGGFFIGHNKAEALKLLLNNLHPEINIKAINKRFEPSDINNELSQNDLVIITIGNSDTQLLLNRALKQSNCSIPVLFVWLEEGGDYSHILNVNYQKDGCYECLYTDADGHLVNNRSRIGTDNNINSIISNGCGGTRAAYGTSVLLRTTAAVLRFMKDHCFSDNTNNCLIDILPDKIIQSNTHFPMEACNCCGTKKN